MSPPANALDTTSVSAARASNGIVSTAQPRASSRALASSSRGDGRPASTTRSGRSEANASTVARPISEVPPSSRMLCGLPTASITGCSAPIDHEVSSKRRDMSEANTPWGSTASRTLRHSSNRG